MNFKKTIRMLPALLLLPLAAHADIITGRQGNTATLLPNGNILITGGVTGTGNSLVVSSASVEIFFTSAAAWGVGAPLGTRRSSHTATLMSDGRVLVAGGFISGVPTTSAEVYDPSAGAAGSWAAVGALNWPRGAHTATLLNKGANRGKVLVCGGQRLTDLTAVNGITPTCELFTPGADTFALTTSMNSARMGHTASGIRNGKVFVSGGMQWNAGAGVYLPTNEMYDSDTGVWTPVSPLNDGRWGHTATVLNNGNIFISGGYNAFNRLAPEELPDADPPVPLNQEAGSRGFLGSAEMFNPEGGREMIVGGDYGVMPYRLTRHSAILSPDGTQITMGGYGNILPTLYSGPSIFADNSYSSMSALGVSSATLLPSSVMALKVKKMLSRTVNGRIVDGDLFLTPVAVPGTDPTIEAENVKIYMVSATTATLDGSPVGHEIPRVPTPDPGQFWNDVTIKTPSGLAIFSAQTLPADLPAQNYVYFSTIVFSPPITSLDAPKDWNPATSSITFNASFKVPGIYVGGRLTGTAEIVNANITVDNQYTLTLLSGSARITNAPVVAEGNDGRINVVLYIGPGSPAPLVGKVANINTNTSVYLGSGVNAAGQLFGLGMIMKLTYTSDRIDLSGQNYNHDPSNMIIREMIFSDQLSFAPDSSKWTFNEISMGMPLFGFTSLVTPAADMMFIGGRNCEASPYTDCVRSRPAPSLSAPTFTASAYNNAYVSQNIDKWPNAPALLGKRDFHTSTVLPDSSVLTCGGSNGVITLPSCELMVQGSGKWVEISSMSVPRALHTATLLPNGTVLVVGGTAGSSTSALNTAELFYPETRRWTPVQPMSSARQNHTANLLPNGDVLVTGGGSGSGYLDTAEIYKTTAAAWETVGPVMNASRANHVSVNMKDGNILVIGGVNGSGATTSVDRYNYASKTWTAMNPLGTPRYQHTANLLRDGRVLVIGGSSNTGSLDTVEIFNGAAWSSGYPMKWARANHKSLLLPNGKVMVTGGERSGVAYNKTESYDPDMDFWNDQGETDPRANHTIVMSQDNYIMNIGGWSGVDRLNTAEYLYFSYRPDRSGLEPKTRNPQISTGTTAVDRGQTATLISSAVNFHGITEAAGGGTGPGNASFSNPRVYLQAVDIPTGFMLDVTTRIYTLYGGPNTNWETTLSSITFTMPLTPGELPYGYYHMRVAANGQFSPGHLVQVTVPRPTGAIAFGAPPGTVLSSTTVRWDWTQNTLSASDGYAIFSSSDGVYITTVAFAGAVSYTQAGLAPNTQVSIKVGGYNTGGYSGLTESPTYYTSAVDPAALTVIYANFETAVISWSPMGNSKLTTYEVTMSKDNFITPAEIVTPVPFNNAHTSTSAVISSLLPNQPYYFRVQAKNGDGITTGYSNTATTTTVSNVTNLSGSPLTMSEINWSWDQSVGSPAYEIYDVTAGTSAAVFLASTTVSSYLQVGLSTNTSHIVGVNAYSGTSKGPVSYAAPVYTLAVAPLPGIPQVFTNITTGSFTLNWIPNGNPDGTQYHIKGGLNSDLSGAATLQVDKTSTTIPGLRPNTLYYGSISARNGAEIPTASASLGSEYTLPQTPSNFRATGVSMSGVALAWDTGDNPGDTIYEVRGSTISTDLNSPTPVNISTYVTFAQYHTSNGLGISGLLTATTYYFDVAAYIRTASKPPGPTARIQTNVPVYTLPGPSGSPSGSVGGSSSPNVDTTISGTLPNRRAVALNIPAASFASQTSIAISSSVTNSCGQGAIPVVEVAVWTDNDAQPQVPVTLTLNYTDTEAATITPNISKLVLARYNPVSGECLPLDTKVDPGNRTITAKLNHFSVFQLIVKSVPTDLSGVRIYPNPFYPNRGQGFVTINNVPAGTEVNIYTLSGDKVWEGTAGSSGMMTWDATNNSGVLVASGIYLAALDSTGGKKVFKIAVER